MGKVNKYIRNNFTWFIPDKLYLSFLFRHRLGYWMDWKNPQTFNEKLQWLKIYSRNPEYAKMVDKATVKEYVASIIGNEYIIPTIGVFKSVEDIDFDKLPNQFVLKCTHDSGGIVVCRDKSQLDRKKTIEKIKKGLKQSFYKINREFPYKSVPRRIIAEQYMEDEKSEELIDYKFFCFNGHADYCQVIANRSTDETIDFYDRQWVRQPFIGLLPTAHHAPKPHHAPKQYDNMLNIADTLSKKIGAPFVRIDLYNINERIYFGEITFFPLSGTGIIRPQEWDYRLGECLDLPIQK